MGREIRRTPLDWEHPAYEVSPYVGGPNRWDWTGQGRHFIPMFDESLTDAQSKWDAESQTYDGKYGSYEEYAGERPTDSDDYRPDWGDAKLGYQFYETVSEGTPLSPPFATLGELADFLVDTLGYDRTVAEAFCEDGWAPSMVVSGNVLYKDIESSVLH